MSLWALGWESCSVIVECECSCLKRKFNDQLAFNDLFFSFN